MTEVTLARRFWLLATDVVVVTFVPARSARLLTALPLAAALSTLRLDSIVEPVIASATEVWIAAPEVGVTALSTSRAETEPAATCELLTAKAALALVLI